MHGKIICDKINFPKNNGFKLIRISHTRNILFERWNLNMKNLGFIGGMIAGAVVGSAITMFIDPISDKQKRKMYKTSNHMFKTMGSVIDAMMMTKH